MNRDRLLIVVEVGSAVCLTVGAALVASAAGWAAAGVLGLVFSWRSAR